MGNTTPAQDKAKKAADRKRAGEERQADLGYRINGGPTIPADQAYAEVTPWDTLEHHVYGAGWVPIHHEKPVFAPQVTHPEANGHYHLTGPIWPPRKDAA